MKRYLMLFCVVILTLVGTANAGGVHQGDNEVDFWATWEQDKYEGGGSSDWFGAFVSVGHYFTDQLMAGVRLGGTWADDDDSYRIGAFGAWGFPISSSSNVLPYVGGFFDYYTGDGDGYAYGPFVGAKFWVSSWTRNVFLFAEYALTMYGGGMSDSMDYTHGIYAGVGVIVP